MKKNIFFLLIFIALSSTLVSCNKDPNIDHKTMMGDKEMMKDESMMWSWGMAKEEIASMKKDDSMMEDDSMMWSWEMDKEKMGSMGKDESMMNKTGAYKDYSSEILASSEWNIVLAFLATWCPSCVSTDKNLSSQEIPDNLTILKVDYDSNPDLKEKYLVTSQHTFVLVDSKWNMIKKWSWSKNAQDILSKIN